MPSERFQCLYCGKVFYTYISDFYKHVKCPDCKEEKKLKHLPTKDVYGYGDKPKGGN